MNNERINHPAPSTEGRFSYRSRRTPELVRRNRRVGGVVALVVVVLVVATVFYVIYYGGRNSTMRQPLHSSLGLSLLLLHGGRS